MGMHLDLDDVSAGHPLAMAELAELRAEIERLRHVDTCGRMCEATAYRTELRQLRAAVRAVMPDNWREDSDWVRLAEAHGLVPND